MAFALQGVEIKNDFKCPRPQGNVLTPSGFMGKTRAVEVLFLVRDNVGYAIHSGNMSEQI